MITFQCNAQLAKENGDDVGFAEFFMRSAEAGCYAPFSIGVMDRAAIHVGEVGQQLADFAWNYRSPHHNYQPLRMILQPLPTRFF